MKILDNLKTLIRGTINLDRLISDGLIVGENFHAQEGVIIDPGHCWLIEIGDNVTLAPRVHILAHDASTKNIIGYTRIAKVSIGNNVFVGAGSIILPGVNISDNTIIGAGSVVTKNLSTGVYAGNPCKLICTYDEFINKNKLKLDDSPFYGSDYIIGTITEDKKIKMRLELENKDGFVI